MPRISVLMSVYNSERYLNAAIESILSQTFGDFEFLVIDDGSTDGTARLLEAIRDSRVQILKNGQNIGVSESINRAIALIGGEYIARMDSDDIALPIRFEQQIRYLDDHPEIDVLGTWMRRVDPQLNFIEDYTVACDHDQIVWSLLFGCMIANPTVMMRRAIFDGYEADSMAEDFGFWARIAGTARFANLPENLLLYRQHEGATSLARRDAQQADIHKRRRQMLNRLLERDIDAEVIDWLAHSQLPQTHLGDGLSDPQIACVISLILETYNGMIRKGWISDQDKVVYADAVQRLMRASRCSGKLASPADLIRYWHRPAGRFILRGVRGLARRLNRWPDEWY